MGAEPGWTVRLHRGTPGAQDTADAARSQGATVIWCEPGCCEGNTVSVFDDPGLDTGLPAQEHRGGEHPDWKHAMPGEELPELPELPEHEELGGEG